MKVEFDGVPLEVLEYRQEPVYDESGTRLLYVLCTLVVRGR